MNDWQLSQQLKRELQTVMWSSGAASRVFGERGVVVFAGTPSADQIPPAFPWCLIGIGTGTADESEPDLIEQSYDLFVGCQVMGDPMGQNAILGGPVATLTSSTNRGVLETCERALFAVGKLTGADGAAVVVSTVSTDSPSLPDEPRHLAVRQFSVSALCTRGLYYAAPQQLDHDANANQWTWEGVHCSDRFDFLRYRLIRKSDGNPSLQPTDGTEVYSGTTASYTGDKTSGNTYTCFAEYDARGRGTVDDFSDPEVGSYVVA